MSEVVDMPAVVPTEAPVVAEASTTAQETIAAQETTKVDVTDVPSSEVPEQEPESTELATATAKVAEEELTTQGVQPPATTSQDTEVQATVDTEVEDPIFCGLLAYRKASATLPFYHKRWFYFTEEATSIDRLHAFYAKYKPKVDKDELNHVVAHAATSGVGLFFLSKSADAVPSGILECQRIVEIKADEHLADKFSISYGGKQVFYFETGAASRDAWIKGITQMKNSSAKTIEEIRASPAYLDILKTLETGTAFNKADLPVGANDVLSEDEAATTANATSSAPAIVEHQAVLEKPDASKSKRASMFFTSLKDKLPHEKPADEIISQESAVAATTEKTPKKDKRKSFIANLMSKKDLSSLKNLEESPTATAEATEELVVAESHMSVVAEVPEAIEELEAADAQTAPPTTEDLRTSPGKSPKAPMKNRVDEFIQRVKKIGERELREIAHSCKTAEGEVNNISEAQISKPDIAAEGEVATTSDTVEAVNSAVVDNTVAVTVPETVETTEQSARAEEITAQNAEPVQKIEDDKVTDEMKTTPEKRPGLARKLTSLFRGRKLTKADAPTTSTVTAEPPQLPETAKVELDSQEPLVEVDESMAVPVEVVPATTTPTVQADIETPASVTPAKE